MFLPQVYKQMEELPASAPRDESRTMLRAATLLIQKAIKDKVFAVGIVVLLIKHTQGWLHNLHKLM